MKAIQIIVIQALIASVGLCLLWQSRQVRHTGHQLDQLNQTAADVEAQIQQCDAHLSKLKSPQRIVRLVKTLDLNLVHPSTEPIDSRPSNRIASIANSTTSDAPGTRN